MNTYRLYLYGRDRAIVQVSEIECPDDGFAVVFAGERSCGFARAELRLDDRLVARFDGGEPKREGGVVQAAAADSAIGGKTSG